MPHAPPPFRLDSNRRNVHSIVGKLEAQRGRVTTVLAELGGELASSRAENDVLRLRVVELQAALQVRLAGGEILV